jgi:hypothetical protein
LEDVVCWLPGGKSFVILDHQQFCDKVLKVTFHHCNYKSFEKQLNNWNFRRELNESGGKAYSHPNFLRGRKSLCQNMTSKSTKPKKVDNGDSRNRIVDMTSGTVRELPLIATPGADDRASALAEAVAKAVANAGGSPVASGAAITAPPNTNNYNNNVLTTISAAPSDATNVNFLSLPSPLAAVAAASSPVAASAALMNALQKRVAANSAMTASTTKNVAAVVPTCKESILATSCSEDLAVALAKATVRRFAALERMQLQQQFQRQQRALLLEQQKLEAQHRKQYQAKMQLLLAAHHQRQQQQQQQQEKLSATTSLSSATVTATPSALLLEKILADKKEQEERVAALLALRLPR